MKTCFYDLLGDGVRSFFKGKNTECTDRFVGGLVSLAVGWVARLSIPVID